MQVFLKINVIKNFENLSGKHMRCRPSGWQLYLKETPTQVLFSKIFKVAPGVGKIEVFK